MRPGTASKLASLAMAAAVLGGCSEAVKQDPGDAPPNPSASASTPGPSAPVREQPLPVPSGAVNDDTGEAVGEHVIPVWDDAARAAAIRTASAAMTAFARPHLEHDTWWAGLEPLLTYDAAVDYSYTDPANVPASEVTGRATVVGEASAYLASVQVPTDAGIYTVLLVRADGDAPWLVERLAPPEGRD